MAKNLVINNFWISHKLNWEATP